MTRLARTADAPKMCALLNAIIEVGGTTAHRVVFNVDQMVEHFIAHPRGISCVVATDGDDIVGFQSLEWSDPDWPGPDVFPADWAVIASFVANGSQGLGIGRRLIEATLVHARAAGGVAIPAVIRKENTGGRAYYAGIGFEEYQEDSETVTRLMRLAG